MNSRYKRGWFGESHRHYLAAKGIKTNKYFASLRSKFADRNAEEIGRGFLRKKAVNRSFVEPVVEWNDPNSKGSKEKFIKRFEYELRLGQSVPVRNEKGELRLWPKTWVKLRDSARKDENNPGHLELFSGTPVEGSPREIAEEYAEDREKELRKRAEDVARDRKELKESAFYAKKVSPELQNKLEAVAKLLDEYRGYSQKSGADIELVDEYIDGVMEEVNTASERGDVETVQRKVEELRDNVEIVKELEERGISYYAKKVDLDKYAGTWKQKSVKNEPWFQKGCAKVEAKYTPVQGGIQVVNTCMKDGKKTSVKGFAKPVSKDNRKLAVDFGFTNPLNIANYEIVKVNPSYTRATVKGGKTVWELER